MGYIWSESDDDAIRARFGFEPVDRIAASLNRSVGAIKRRARELGVWRCGSIEGAAPNSILRLVHNNGGPAGYQPLPTTPTKARPGTLEKVQVLARRVMQGEELWHDDDPNVKGSDPC